MSRVPSPPVEPPATGDLPPLRQPTDAELVTDYLRPWLALGDPNFDSTGIGAYMHCGDMYDDAPYELTRRREYPPLVSQDGQTRWYFRTPVFPKNTYNQDGRRSASGPRSRSRLPRRPVSAPRCPQQPRTPRRRGTLLPRGSRKGKPRRSQSISSAAGVDSGSAR